MSHECQKYTTCEQGNDCVLLSFLNHQSNKGALPQPGSWEKGANGPYWPKKAWINLVDRTSKSAKNGCLKKDIIYQRGKELTEEKRANGTLIDNPNFNSSTV